jgi:hypothetical protein
MVAGCATHRLADMTVSQGDSVSDIEFRMVLSNLALYRTYRPEALEDSPLPWHLKITQGSAEVVDTVNPTFGQTVIAPEQTIGVSISRGVTVNWTFVPEVDTAHLTKLRQLYFDATRDATFSADFQAGRVPVGTPCGRYEGLYVCPKPGRIGALTTLTLKVLAETPIDAEDKPVLLPGPIR